MKLIDKSSYNKMTSRVFRQYQFYVKSKPSYTEHNSKIIKS